VANPKDIDIAMKYGTNYPFGPIEWGEKIGFKNIVTVLDALYHHHHDERYRAAPLLRQLAIAGTFWKENE
jgi:3-hydroxybutyryl-CoA dehydrogenase